MVQRNGIWLTMLYLLITAIMGVLMRSMALFFIPSVDYSHVLHAHSHVAILGWGFMALFLLIHNGFIGKREQSGRKQLRILFWTTQLTIFGMLVSFTMQGYSFFSIMFSTLHIFASYWFAVWVWSRLEPRHEPKSENPLSVLFLKGSLVSLVLSSIGPWLLAILSANDLNGSPWYDAAIYYYLHMQYNGWFALALIAVLLRLLEHKGIAYSTKQAKLLFQLYGWSLLPSFLSSILWMSENMAMQTVAAIASIVQWICVILLAWILHKVRIPILAMFQGWARVFFFLSLAALLMKTTMNLGTISPSLSTMIYDTRPVVIGYLHLVLLGFVSFLCIALFLQQGWLSQTSGAAQIGYALFIIGFIVNEGVLFLQGLMNWLSMESLPRSAEWLWLASILMAVGVGLGLARIPRRR